MTLPFVALAGREHAPSDPIDALAPEAPVDAAAGLVALDGVALAEGRLEPPPDRG